jgi:hypothetical protein
MVGTLAFGLSSTYHACLHSGLSPENESGMCSYGTPISFASQITRMLVNLRPRKSLAYIRSGILTQLDQLVRVVSLDHLIGAGEERGWDREVEGWKRSWRLAP